MSGRILIVDDVPTNRALLKAKLSTAYFDVITIDSSADAVQVAETEQPDLILIDVTMPEHSGYGLCERLKSAPNTFHIPVVMITASAVTEQRIKGLEVGADDFLSKPFDDLTLIARVRSLMRFKIMFDEMRLRDDTSRELGLDCFLQEAPSIEDVAGSVLISGSCKEQIAQLQNVLSQNIDMDLTMSSGEAETIEAARKNSPDLVIIHQNFVDKDAGYRILSALRTTKTTRQSAIIFVVERNQEAVAASALDLGANDYLVAPIDSNELMVRVRSQLRRKRYSDRLRSNVVDGLKMAVIDPLTGLYNRRYALQHLQAMSERALKENAPFSILMMDLDEFKIVNDRYGHAAGDEVLTEFSRRMQENVRGIDLVARIGGEEFFVAMPDTNTDQAVQVAERLREAMETRPFIIQGHNANINVTVSIGVAESDPEMDAPDAILRNADAALYKAKNNGRNAVIVFSTAA